MTLGRPAGEPGSLGAPRWLRGSLSAAAFLLVALLAGSTLYLQLFIAFAPWDDEGYMLVSLKEFREGGALYDEVYSQYGPFYFVAMDGLYTVLGLEVTHNSGRLVTMGVWLAAGLLCGLAAFGMSRSLWLGLGVLVLVVKGLITLYGEPMHPAGLICLLLSCMVAASTALERFPRLSSALLGLAAAGLLLTKVNIGGFALIALAFAIAAASPETPRRRPLVLLTAAAFVATPVALMAAHLDQLWARRYAFHVAVAALAVSLAALRPPRARFPRPLFVWLIGGAAATAIVTCAIVLLRGTTPGELVNAVLIQPLSHAKAHTGPLQLPPHIRKAGLVALALCMAALFLARQGWPIRSRWLLATGLCRLAAGLAISGTAGGGFTPWPQGFLLAPLAWVAVVAPHGLEGPDRLAWPRRFLPSLAVLQTLHAYPVAGSQIQWSAFLLVPVGGICLTDAGRQLARWLHRKAPARGRIAVPVMGAAMGALLCFYLALRPLHQWLQYVQHVYRHNVPLELPGADRLHLPAPEAETYTWLSRKIRENCSSFVTMPGLNSFYLWSRREPPTGLNTTAWMYLLDARTQRRIVDRIQGMDRICVVRNLGAAAAWQQGRELPPSPLVDAITRDFVPLESRGGYELLVRSSRSAGG